MDWATQQTILYHAPFSAVVDINGRFNPKTGKFWQVDDAIDAGHKSIFIREGTYAPFDMDVAKLVVCAESWDVIIDGATTDDAIDISAANAYVFNLQVKTTGGSGNAFDGIEIAAGGADAEINRIFIPDSDQHGIYSYARCNIRSCVITGCDGSGIAISPTGDDSRIVDNYIYSNTGWGTTESANAENCIYVANRVTGNGSGQIEQGSGTGVYVGNDET